MGGWPPRSYWRLSWSSLPSFGSLVVAPAGMTLIHLLAVHATSIPGRNGDYPARLCKVCCSSNGLHSCGPCKIVQGGVMVEAWRLLVIPASLGIVTARYRLAQSC